MNTRKSYKNNIHLFVFLFLFLLIIPSLALQQPPKSDNKTKKSKYDRIKESWNLSEEAAEKLQYEIQGFSFSFGSMGSGTIPWTGETSTGEYIKGRFSMIPMDDGTIFSRHYVDMPADLKTRTALLSDWTKTNLLDSTKLERTGTEWENLTNDVHLLQYKVKSYGVASGNNQHESAVIWQGTGSNRWLDGIFSFDTEKDVTRWKAVINSQLDNKERELMLKSWVDANVISSAIAAAVMKDWNEAADKITKNGYTTISYSFSIVPSNTLSAKIKWFAAKLFKNFRSELLSTSVEWQGTDESDNYITGSY